MTQEVFLQVWRQASGFDPQRGSVKSWMATLAHRRAVDVVRRSQSAGSGAEGAGGRAVGRRCRDGDPRRRARSSACRPSARPTYSFQVIEMALLRGLTYREVAGGWTPRWQR